MYNIGILKHRTNINLRHFISQTLTSSSSNYPSIQKGNEFKFITTKRENMYLRSIELNSVTDIKPLETRPRNKLHLRNACVCSNQKCSSYFTMVC